jgi:hypothetical protein
MKTILCCLCCLCCRLGVAGDATPPVPPGSAEAPPLTEEQIAEAERLADAIMSEGRTHVPLSEADRATYTQALRTADEALAAATRALAARDRTAAGDHYVVARKAFITIPREAGTALGQDYYRVARNLLACAKLVLGPEIDLPDPPPADPGVAPAIPAPAPDPAADDPPPAAP